MKKVNSSVRLVIMTGVTFGLAISAVLAQDTNAPAAQASTTQAVAATPGPQVTTPSSPAKLPFGVEDVLKLSRANISEDIILNYVQNSGTIYNLGPQDLVHLRDQGVSDHVLNAMLNQRKVVEAVMA